MNDVKTDFLYLYPNVDYDAATSLGNVVTSSVEGTKIYNFSKKQTEVSFEYELPDNEQSAVLRVPLLYYNGYKAYINGEPVEISPDDVYVITVQGDRPAGTVIVRFEAPRAWNEAYIISITFGILFIAGLIIGTRRSHRRQSRGKIDEAINDKEVQKGVSMETFPYSEFSGIYLDNSLMDDGEKELTVKTPSLSLVPGVYRVDVVYSTGNSRNFLSVQSGKRWLSTADKAYIALPEGEDRTESVILRTFFSMDDLSISVHYPGDGYIYVTGVTVTRIPGFPWPFLILGIELFAVLHILSFLWRRYGECGGRRKILVFLLGLSVTVSLPIFSVYLGTGDDLEYHLLRIDALAAGLRSGQFPVRVSSYWNNGYGYGSSLYYCDFFLLFPALLRIGGLSVQSAYKQYLFAVNCLTAALCWYWPLFAGILSGKSEAGKVRRLGRFSICFFRTASSACTAALRSGSTLLWRFFLWQRQECIRFIHPGPCSREASCRCAAMIQRQTGVRSSRLFSASAD